MIHVSKIFILFCAATLVLTGGLHAQQPQVKSGDGVKIKGLEFEAQQTPEFSAGGVKNKNIPNPREWLEIEAEFEVDKASPKDAILPELKFRYYVGLMDESNKPVVLSGDVDYVNVISGEEYYSAVYVHPSTMGKITGEHRRLDKGSIKAVGVEVYYQGVLVGGHSTTGKKFWEAGTTPGILSKDKTPFALLWIDRYPEVKAN